MSSDFAFWKTAVPVPEDTYDSLAEGLSSGLQPHPDVVAFRGELLKRWPDLVDVLEPIEQDVIDDPDDGAKYVLLTLPLRMLGRLEGIFELAEKYQLRGFSGVAGEAF
ncbi:hypothetical protein BJY16_004956 [Actinoplanes octamycinicus]|uniref:Uncharacterized protein n=1 Tax=Actinoplanes octamycinicus TaxID=135948 RepID=A0A7W7M928_9ACTN|nr:hypothetical protein [Actinoplanes octamycinicus]MBB4741497.1 hypothetical protein [Actinoplanes octamycinicus]GIE57047.1 hypothetical protein Aoc01nite_24490 [Actinoplanes octamycinicus]